MPGGDAIALERWDAEFSVHAPAVGGAWRSLDELGAEVAEGLRPGRYLGPEPLTFRPAHIVGGLLAPDAEHIHTPPLRSPRAVGPGDVLVGKFLPARAGLVAASVPRHVPDANCVRITGLRPDQALWLVALFDHPDFASHLAHHSAGRVLPRLGARDLAEMTLPPVPVEVASLTAPWTEASEGLLAARRDLVDLRAEAQALADDTAPPPPDARRLAWITAAEMPDTWAPDRAALARYRLHLQRCGWVPLSRFQSAASARLRDAIQPARVLHLGDVADDLGFQPPAIEPVRPPWFRLYAAPLRPGEVLLSTLGSAPKVAWNEPACPSTVWLSDQWARLDGGAAAGALALLLETHQVTWQLGCATTGAVRQFIGREDLAGICIPAPPPVVAAALHRRALAVTTRRHEAESRLARLRARLASLVTQALRGVA